MNKSMISLLCCIMMGALVYAQPPGPMGERFQHQMERLDRYKKIRMVEALNLDDETGLKLVTRYNKHRERMRELESERSVLIDKLDEQVRSNANDGDLQKSFNDFFDVEKKTSEARKKFLEELKEIFTNKQIAEFIVFERDFMKDLRKAAREVQKERQEK
ncbi:MAG: hypothetical protein WCW40_08675 [Bacteroidota bacterium]